MCQVPDGAEEVKPCNEDITCDADCEGGWAPWGECSMGCHGGFQRRVYAIRKEASGRGSRCLHVHGESETRKCPPDSCPQPCSGLWSSWRGLLPYHSRATRYSRHCTSNGAVFRVNSIVFCISLYTHTNLFRILACFFRHVMIRFGNTNTACSNSSDGYVLDVDI